MGENKDIATDTKTEGRFSKTGRLLSSKPKVTFNPVNVFSKIFKIITRH